MSERDYHEISPPKDGIIKEADGKAQSTGARFKLDIMYDEKFSMKAANLGVISVWGSGGDKMPLADWKIYECPDRSCPGLITPATHAYTITSCPMCKRAWKPIELVGEMVYKVTADKWAGILAKYIHRLEFDADIYLKRLKSSTTILKAEEEEKLGRFRGELLEEARRKETVMYNKERLLADVVAGTPLESAIRAFLLA